MKTFVKLIVAFAVIITTAVIVDIIFGSLADNITRSRGLTKQSYVMSTIDNYDLIFVGSSRAHRHYDTPYITDSLGIKAFNAGEDGRGITYQYPILKAYLQKNHPKFVVIDLSTSLDGKWNDRISMLYPLANKYNEIMDVAEMIDPDNKYYLKSNLYRYNSNLITEIRGLRHPFSSSSTLGFDPAPVRKASKGNFVKNKIRSYSNKIDSIEYNLLIELIGLCKNKSVNVVGIFSPIYGSIERPHDIDRIFKANNIPLIDNISYRLPLEPDEYFKDETHLNERGAREYTKYVIRQLSDSLQTVNI